MGHFPSELAFGNLEHAIPKLVSLLESLVVDFNWTPAQFADIGALSLRYMEQNRSYFRIRTLTEVQG